MATWTEFTTRFGRTSHRRKLITGLRAALINLRQAGCLIAYVDGSFVTDKTHPSDFDACWDAQGVDPTKLDPVLLSFQNGRAAQKAKYRGELFLTNLAADRTGRTFLDFFQVDKGTGLPKGIVALELAGI